MFEMVKICDAITIFLLIFWILEPLFVDFPLRYSNESVKSIQTYFTCQSFSEYLS